MDRSTLRLALVLSAGAHLIVLLTIGVAPGGWRQGVQPALTVTVASAPAESSGTRVVPKRAAPDGLAAARNQSGAQRPAPAHRYFTRQEVDVAAVPIEQGPLIFPENAYAWRLAGVVVARVFISATGTVDAVEIVDAKPHRGIFEEAALHALRQVRYEPARIGGEPVRSQKVIEVKFDPYEKPA